MNLKKTIGIGIFTFLACKSQSQNFELVENKGQWNAIVKYQGRLLNGAFFLEPQGYKVLQHNAKDLQQVTAAFHGHDGDVKPSGNTGVAADAKSISQKNSLLTLRSHAYEVLFDQSNTNPEIIPEKPQPGYNNYFTGNDPKAWATNCKIY